MKKANFLLTFALLSFPPYAAAQEADTRARVRAVRDLAKGGAEAVPKVAAYLIDKDVDVRLEVVKQLGEIGGPRTIDPLITAAKDSDPEVQIRATDGLVNVYLPGYMRSGLSGTLRRAGNSVKGKFTDTNDQIIDSYIEVRPDVIEVLARLVGRNAATLESRANAARAVGILRGKAALPELVEALRSKDDRLMYESLIAIQKIGDPDVAPRITFVLRDLDERVQITALETTGLLRNKAATPEIRDAIDRARTEKVKRAGAGALAMIADPGDHPRFIGFLADRDDAVRAAGGEGLGRLRNPVDRSALDRAFGGERSTNARLAMAFALSMLGSLETAELAPFRYLVNTLNLRTYKNVALAYLIELAREQPVRQALYTILPRATKEEKIGLSMVLGRSGDRDSMQYLQTLSMDSDTDVAAEGLRGLRTLRARLP